MICPCCLQPMPETDAEIAAEVERGAKFRPGSPKHAAHVAALKALQAAKKRASGPQCAEWAKCARTACNNPADPRLVHRDNGLTYCPKCARRINEENGVELIPWPRVLDPRQIDPADAELVALVCTLGDCTEKEALPVALKARSELPAGTIQEQALKACSFLRS